MAKKTPKTPPRYVVNDKLPKEWNRLLKLGDYLQLSRVLEKDSKPRGLSSDEYDAFCEIGRPDRVELGIALFSFACILVTFFVLR